MNIDEMEAGREMDALVAEKVMGFKLGPKMAEVWSPSTDIKDAWEVVEKMKRFEVIKYPDGHYFAGTGDIDPEDFWEFGTEAPTAPLAICRAALKSVEGK